MHFLWLAYKHGWERAVYVKTRFDTRYKNAPNKNAENEVNVHHNVKTKSFILFIYFLLYETTIKYISPRNTATLFH